jgi:multiple sugar transport system ATP-binding protein
MASIDLVGLSKVYPGGVAAIDDLTLTIADGEFFALLGPSGCGKTTLLRTIAGLEEVTSGSLLLDGKDVTRVPAGKRDVAMVFQDYALFPHMDVTDNISYPLRIQKVGKNERHDKARQTGAGLGLEKLMERRPGQLSGGQQQRVALARAIAYQPSVFLFDEPLSNLDARLRLEARTFLKRLQHDLRVTTVFVTHDQAEALAMADTIAVMEAGHIRQIGTPSDVFHRPANVFVANFIGSTPMNLVPGSAFGAHVEPEGDDVLVGFRPEYTKLASPDDADGRYALRGTVSIVENLGASMLVSVACDDRSVQALVAEGEEPPVDAAVSVNPADKRVLRYRAADGELLDSLSRMPVDR